MRSINNTHKTTKAEVSQAIYNAHQVKCVVCGTKAVKVLRAGTIYNHQHVCSNCLDVIKDYADTLKSENTLKTA